MKLYHYVHCPFCIRVRMALGRLEIPYKSVILPYEDEKTPMELCGQKMLPIVQWAPGDQMNESLEIIKRLDEKNILHTDKLNDPDLQGRATGLIEQLSGPIHNLVMPYWIWTPEFTDDSRSYFLKKKSAKRGPFHILAQRREEFSQQLVPLLGTVESQVHPFYLGEQLSIFDIMLASHLWGIYLVPEWQLSPSLHQYLQTVGRVCRFTYHGQDFWNELRRI